MANVCKCSHSKQDHQVIAASGRGSCCQCVCDAFVPLKQKPPKPKLAPEPELARPAQNNWILR